MLHVSSGQSKSFAHMSSSLVGWALYDVGVIRINVCCHKKRMLQNDFLAKALTAKLCVGPF